MVDLTQVPATELQAELARRSAEAERLRAEARKQQEQLWFAHLETLLALIPEHDRIGCNDDNTSNKWGRCRRCILVEAKSIGMWEERATLEITIRFDG